MPYVLLPYGRRLVEIVHEHGSAIVSYDIKSKRFLINTLDVEAGYRRQGIGKNMLAYSKDIATKMGAQIVSALIISRESLDAMTAVFGEEAIDIESAGRYELPDTDAPARPDEHTVATLLYRPHS
jgi:GNAT superfamily N-acetyltransferase